MTDYATAPYWAITGLGYGKGFTPEEAVENYLRIQMRNWQQSREAILDAGWGRVWKAPEGTTGFVADGEIRWEIDGEYVKAEQDQIVGDVGNVPE